MPEDITRCVDSIAERLEGPSLHILAASRSPKLP